MSVNRWWARLAPAMLVAAWAAPAIAQEFIVSDRPALPHPANLTFSLQGFEFGPEVFGQVTSFGIKPLDGLPGFGLEVLAAEAATGEALAAQAEFFGDIKNTAEAIERASILESGCGLVDDSQHVEFYNGSGRVPRSFVDTHEPYTIQLQWSELLAFDGAELSPGTVRGVRWCSGSYVGNNRILTAGHCFRPDDGSGSGYVTPFRRSGVTREFLQPSELAPLFFANFRYQVDGQTSAVRVPVQFPITRLVEYRNGGLDYAIAEVGASPDGRSLGDLAAAATLGDPAAYPDGSIIAIIQHPNGDPKKVASGTILARRGEWIYYDNLDTNNASSGSGIATDDGHVIGVHTNGGAQR